jgi:hypothetical protein
VKNPSPGPAFPSVHLLTKKDKAAAARLLQILLVPAITGNRLSGLGALPVF